MKEFVFYLHHDIFDSANFSDENIEAFKNKIYPLVEIARCNLSPINYLLKDVTKLESELVTLDDYFTKSPANLLSLILEDSNKAVKACSYIFRILFADNNTCLEFFSSHNIKSNQIPILLTYNNIGETQLLLKADSEHEFEKITLNTFNCKIKMWEFINSQLSPNYNFSSKHGDKNTKANPPNNKEKVSQLMTDLEKTQELINSSIFDLRENSWRYNFDFENNCYIVFPCEGKIPQNTFHAFHIEQNEWQKEIPKSIRKYFMK